MDGLELVREYYRSIDDDEYGALADVLSDEFVHHRPDRAIEGRKAFVEFMRDERPERDTEHALETVYLEDGGARAAAEGRLLHSDGEEWFRFVDTFDIDRFGVCSVRTYTDLVSE